MYMVHFVEDKVCFLGLAHFPSPMHLLSRAFAPKQLNLTHNHFFFLNGHVVYYPWGV